MSASLGNLSGTSKVPDEQYDPFANGNFPEKEFCLKQAERQASWPLSGHFKTKYIKRDKCRRRFSLLASSPIWVSLARTRERGAVLARLASHAQIGELARRLEKVLNCPRKVTLV